MKILKILVACFAVLVLSVFFVFELIFARSVDNSLSAYAEENITSDSVELLSGDDPSPSIIDYHWDLSGFEQYNLNFLYPLKPSTSIVNTGVTYLFNFDGSITVNGSANNSVDTYVDHVYSFTFFSGVTYTSYLYSSDNSSPMVIDAWLNNINYRIETSTVNVFSFTENVTIIFRIVQRPSLSYNNSIYFPIIVKGTYTAETMPAYQPNLKYIFTTAFTYGYKDGYDTGYDSGRNYGYNLGYVSGYDTGYSYGRNSQISEGLFKNPLDVFLQPISNFLNTDIFGSFSIGDGFTIAFFVMIALIFIKMFAGG